MTYNVQNLNGTGDDNSPSGSWIEFWENKTRLKANFCNATDCYSKAEVGAHVQIVGKPNVQYIVPLCKGCNKRTGVFNVSGPLVPVNSNNQILW